MGEQASVPIPVVRRLSDYLQNVRMQMELGREWISSLELAEALEVTSSTVRQDLSWLDISGTAKRGYKIEDLESAIAMLVGRDRSTSMVIVGAGNLGRALALHEELPRHGFVVSGVFDADPRIVGEKVGKFVIRNMDELPQVVRGENADIGVVAVVAKLAQDATDSLVSAGVRGILNMSWTHVRIPEGVSIVEARMFANLNVLSYAIKARKGS